jgi:hypothetical protein
MTISSSEPRSIGVETYVAADDERSYVDWPAIFAGAVVALALAFVLGTFGSGIGLTMTGTPWGEDGASLGWFLLAAAIWYIWVQVTSVMAGGYIAGRLRRRLNDGDPHEVEVRDGAHGLAVWAVGVVVGAMLLLGAAAAGIGTATSVAGMAAGATAAGGSDAVESLAEQLFRPLADTSQTTGSDTTQRSAAPPATASGATADQTGTNRTGAAGNPASPPAGAGSTAAERPDFSPAQREMDRRDVGRIIAASVATGEVVPADRRYIARLVANATGMSLPEAQARVDEQLTAAVTALHDAAETARQTGIVVSFLVAVTFLISGIAGWWAAGIGGSHRDEGIDLTRWLRIR